jgi:hypothetical protein
MRHRAGILVSLAAVVAVAITWFAGCAAPYPNALRDGSGNEIRFSEISPILYSTDLTEDQKKEALRNLGITDEELINLLLAQT